jgi:ABC-type phosphate/phosphonate transport system substrate-binding protein
MAHMSEFIAALPMYDWPEARSETDALWSGIRDLLRKQGIGAPEKLVRSNADMPPVKGGIRDAAGQLIAPDPAELPSDDLDMHVLWRHPKLLFAQACWGPMELGLAGHVRVVGQPDYSAFEGGQGELYSSAILMRRSGKGIGAPGEGGALIPRDLLRGKRLAFNSPDSMSGIIALTRDLAALGENPEIFSERIETGSHRASAVAVARGEADVCAVDCRTWDLIRRFEPAAAEVEVVGWTARRRGLPYISSLSAPRFHLDALDRSEAFGVLG